MTPQQPCGVGTMISAGLRVRQLVQGVRSISESGSFAKTKNGNDLFKGLSIYELKTQLSIQSVLKKKEKLNSYSKNENVNVRNVQICGEFL